MRTTGFTGPSDLAAGNSQMHAILVSGAGKGIGEACALHLAGQGHLVFAGVRKPQDGAQLRERAGERIVPLQLDVTHEAELRTAAEQVADRLGERGLTGLVNNAGIAIACPLEFLPLAELRHQLEVNVVGQVALTQAMLPLLRRAHGRIVNIGSVAGRSALPMIGPYAASKHALEALTDSLRVELSPWGLHVAIVEPGVIATPIWQTSLQAADRILQALPPRALEYYGRTIDTLKKRVMTGAGQGLPPARVAEVVSHALFATRPRTRYVVGRDARVRLLLEKLPDRLRDRLIARRLRG
jgi:NAD(P)-dependent dehydrogenase (short-subunit alcohol dehydrogenase family)